MLDLRLRTNTGGRSEKKLHCAPKLLLRIHFLQAVAFLNILSKWQVPTVYV
jgi:hypothetical protein